MIGNMLRASNRSDVLNVTNLFDLDNWLEMIMSMIKLDSRIATMIRKMTVAFLLSQSLMMLTLMMKVMMIKRRII